METKVKTGTVILVDKANFYGVLREDFTHTEFVFSVSDKTPLRMLDMVTFERDEMFEHPVAKRVKPIKYEGMGA